MIMWRIKHGEKELNLDIGDCTVLVDQSVTWYELIRLIDDYFNNRHSIVQIEEDASNINKKDWNCYFIPFDAQLQMDKITAKSPLNSIISDCVEQLSMSPAFFELKEMWGELQEEAFFVNESLKKYELKATVSDMNDADIKKFISLSSTKSILSPIEYKLLLLRLIDERNVDKKTLVIIELPELFADKESLLDLKQMIQKMKSRGIRFLIVTNDLLLNGRKNYCINNEIINEISVELVKRRVIMDAPFGVEEKQYDLAKQDVFRAVDNSIKKNEDKEFHTQEESIQVLVYMIFRNLNIPKYIDTEGFPSNIIEFIGKY